MHSKPLPAIQRDYCEKDVKVAVLSTCYNSGTFERGLGKSGRRIEYVEYDCPVCGADRMVREDDVYPEIRSRARYWCTKPTCPHFVGDRFSYIQAHRASEVAVEE